MKVERLLDLDELAWLLWQSPETVRRDMKRNPLAVPPCLQVPGTRLLRWRPCDVHAWLDECAGTAQTPEAQQ